MRGDRNKAQILTLLLSLFGREQVVTEHVFHPDRKWRFDYAVPHLRLAVEYQGHGLMAGGKKGAGKKHVGGHASVDGLANDCEKLNAAQSLGWRVIKFTALHFSGLKRRKHKLTSPHDTLAPLAGP